MGRIIAPTVRIHLCAGAQIGLVSTTWLAIAAIGPVAVMPAADGYRLTAGRAGGLPSEQTPDSVMLTLEPIICQ
jgi:hypothetical protein